MILLVQALLLYVAWRSGKDARRVSSGRGRRHEPRGGRADAGTRSMADAALAPVLLRAPAGARRRLAGWLAPLAGTAAPAAPDARTEPAGANAADGAGAAAAPASGLAMRWMNRRMLCIVLLLLAVVLGANFWVGIVGNTFDDLELGHRRAAARLLPVLRGRPQLERSGWTRT